MEIPSSERNGIPCISMKDLNIFFLNFFKDYRFLSRSKNNVVRKQEKFSDDDLFSRLIALYKNAFLPSHEALFPADEQLIKLNLHSLVKPYKQTLSLKACDKIEVGNSDFSFECCASLPNKPYIFIGNRSGELYVLHKDTKEIVKTIACPDRIGAVKYIPDKNIIIVAGLNKFILKVSPETLEIVDCLNPQQSTDCRNFIVIEYLKNQDLLLLGGFNTEHSIELYNYQDLTLNKTITFENPLKQKTDELWTSVALESGKIIALGYRSGVLQLWRSSDFKLIHQIQTGRHINTLESDQKLIYTGHLNGGIQVFKVVAGAKLLKMKYISTGTFTINKIRFLHKPYAKYLVVSSFGKTLSIWNSVGNKIDETSAFEEQSRAILVLDNSNIMSTGVTPGAVYFLKAQSLQDQRSHRTASPQLKTPNFLLQEVPNKNENTNMLSI